VSSAIVRGGKTEEARRSRPAFRRGRARPPGRRSRDAARACGAGEDPAPAHFHFRSSGRAGHDRPLSAGVHAAGDPALGPGGDRLRDEAFALGAFAGQFPRPADGLGFPASLGLGWLLVSRAGLHFPEDALALHLLLERLQRLVDIVVPDHDLYDLKLSIAAPPWPSQAGSRRSDIMEHPYCVYR